MALKIDLPPEALNFAKGTETKCCRASDMGGQSVSQDQVVAVNGPSVRDNGKGLSA